MWTKQEGRYYWQRCLVQFFSLLSFSFHCDAFRVVPMFDGLDNEVETGTVSTYGVGITALEALVARHDDKKKSFRSSRRNGDANMLPVLGFMEPSKNIRLHMNLDNAHP
jgi:hypothetical protein